MKWSSENYKNRINEGKPINCEVEELDISFYGKKHNCTLDKMFDYMHHNVSGEICSLIDLKNLINLKKLDCSFDKITSLKGIEHLINLEEIDCCYNKIESIDEFKKCLNFL